jgi:hypothetical protein
MVTRIRAFWSESDTSDRLAFSAISGSTQRYGLSAAVWKRDVARAYQVARGIRIIEASEFERRSPGRFVADVSVGFKGRNRQYRFVLRCCPGFELLS